MESGTFASHGLALSIFRSTVSGVLSAKAWVGMRFQESRFTSCFVKRQVRAHGGGFPVISLKL
jgi:hypothetical protein